MDYEWIEKTILKKSDQKLRKKKQKNNVKMPHVNKKTTSEKWKINSNKKLGLEWAVNGLGKPFRKKSDPKNRKNSKHQSEIAACEQKTTTEKPNFCSDTIFALYFKIKAQKKLTPQNHSLFRSISCFGVTKITTPIWLQKSWKCEQILKKRQRPNTIQILWIVKNQDHRNIATLSLQLRSYNNSLSCRFAAIKETSPAFQNYSVSKINSTTDKYSNKINKDSISFQSKL